MRRPRRSPLFPYTTLFRSWTGLPRHPQLLSRTHLDHGHVGPAEWRAELDHRRRLRRSEEHTSELQSHVNLVCRLLLEKQNTLDNFDATLKAFPLRGLVIIETCDDFLIIHAAPSEISTLSLHDALPILDWIASTPSTSLADTSRSWTRRTC